MILILETSSLPSWKVDNLYSSLYIYHCRLKEQKIVNNLTRRKKKTISKERTTSEDR
jgi:hypothetical protein